MHIHENNNLKNETNLELLDSIIKFNNTHPYTKEGCQWVTLLDSNILSKLKDGSEIIALQRVLRTDYCLELVESVSKHFIHLTSLDNFVPIKDLGILPNPRECSSFGSGIYFYELNNRTIEFLKTLRSFSGVVFKLNEPYMRCIYDFCDGSHNGQYEYPPYCYCTRHIKSENILCFIDNNIDLLYSYAESVAN